MRLALLAIALFGGSVIARPTKEALCSYGTSNYSLSWEYDELSSDVVFRLTATSAAHNFWTGVYFGEEEPFDAIGVFIRNGQIGLVDAHLPAGEEATVVADDLTNVQSLQFDMVEGRLTAEFARPLSSHDKQDTDLAKCSTFFFPEAEEITRSGQITLPTMSMSRRVCDIARNCPARRANRKNQEQFKREESADAAPEAKAAAVESAPLVEADTEAPLEKKEAVNPPVCSYDKEGAKVDWYIDGDDVHFKLAQPNKKGKFYSAFGIGESMQDLKAVLAFTENGKLKKLGAYETTGHALPTATKIEPTLISNSNAKGQSYLEFSAPKAAFGSPDFSGCVTLQLGLYIGKYANQFKAQKHTTLPLPLIVCGWDKCPGAQNAEEVVTAEASGLESEGSGEEQPKEDGLLFNVFPSSTPKAEAAAEVKTTGKPAEPTTTAGVEPKPEEKTTAKAEEKATTAKAEEKTTAKPEEKIEKTTAKAVEAKAEEVEGSGEDESKTAEEMEAEIAKHAATTVPTATVDGKCNADHKDLKVCSPYFADYLGKVKEWADNHEQKLEDQMWKACTLLSEVKHVPSMCCTIFHETCDAHLKN